MISGGIKFFDRSRCLLADGASVTASSGAASEDSIIDKNPDSYWRSVGSSDATTETVTITFASRQISRILCLDLNWKGFVIQYWNGAAWTHFSGVTGLGGALSNITETAFAYDAAYYEFTPVTTTQIRIQITTTQVANAEKYCSQAIVTNELGTLSGYPDVKTNSHSRNERVKKMLSGKSLIIKSVSAFECALNFKGYPSSFNTDLDLMLELFDREEGFIVWLCGGRTGSAYFRYQIRGFRLKDAYEVNTFSNINPGYLKNIYTGPIELEVKFKEIV